MFFNYIGLCFCFFPTFSFPHLFKNRVSPKISLFLGTYGVPYPSSKNKNGLWLIGINSNLLLKLLSLG